MDASPRKFDDREAGVIRKLSDPGFTPGTRDTRTLLRLLGDLDDDQATRAERILTRVGAALTEWIGLGIKTQLAGTASDEPVWSPKTCVRALRALGKTTREGKAFDVFLSALEAPDSAVRKEAAVQLGKSGAGVHEARAEKALLRVLAEVDADTTDDRAQHRAALRRAVVEALGKVGGTATLAALRAQPHTDSTADTVTTRAQLRAERTHLRAASGGSQNTHSAVVETTSIKGLPVVFYCRRGLEDFVRRDLTTLGMRIDTTDPCAIYAEGDVRLIDLRASRCHLEFGFLLNVAAREDAADTITALLTSPEARALYTRFTHGKARIRVAFEGLGHQRALQWTLAEKLRARGQDVMSDPTDSSWEARVHLGEEQIAITLILKALPDARFSRTKDVPASSHPTLAAALVAAVGAYADDVVWDPFVGAGTELLERAELGPYVRMFGTDIEASAIAAARTNLMQHANIELRQQNALTFRPSHLTTIVTNPPLGRRVVREKDLGPMLDALLTHGAGQLTEGGRFAWFSPRPAASRQVAASAGLKLRESFDVDMGGFSADLQVFVKGASSMRGGRV